MRPMTGLRVLSIALVAVGCSSGMRNTVSSPVMPAADAAAIRAVFDTTAFGWNHGDLSAYLYAYAPSATAIGRTGLVRGPSGIEQQMRAGFWKTGRPTQSLSYDHLEIRQLGRNHAFGYRAVHFDRRGPAGSHRLVFDDLGAHTRRLADDSRSFLRH
jgi:hypothetical protein